MTLKKSEPADGGTEELLVTQECEKAVNSKLLLSNGKSRRLRSNRGADRQVNKEAEEVTAGWFHQEDQ